MKMLRRSVLVWGMAACVPAVAGSYEDFFVAIQRDDAATITMLLQRGISVQARRHDAVTKRLAAGECILPASLFGVDGRAFIVRQWFFVKTRACLSFAASSASA